MDVFPDVLDSFGMGKDRGDFFRFIFRTRLDVVPGNRIEYM